MQGRMNSNPHDEALIKGIILTVVKDAGPEIVANLSPIPEENALITALHMVSLAGLEGDTRDEDDSKIIGPLPVKSSSEFKALYYSNTYKVSDDVMDERLRLHGSKVGIILLFDAEKLPMIRRAAGLIEPYLEVHLNKIDDISEITRDFAINLRDKIIEIATKPRLRTFWMDEEGVYEYRDANYVKRSDDVLILDEISKKIYMINQKGQSVFVIRKMINRVNEMNMKLYQNGYQVVTLESFEEIETLLIKHNIAVTE